MNKVELRKILCAGLANIAPEADFDALADSENLREELDIDSFDFLKFLIGLHDALGVDIPESDYEQLVSMDDLLAYLMQRLV